MEVWKNVEAYWAHAAAGNTEVFMAYFDVDYMRWSLSNNVPSSKASATKFISDHHKSSKILVYDTTPAVNKIHGDVVFVHDRWPQTAKDSTRKE